MAIDSRCCPNAQGSGVAGLRTTRPTNVLADGSYWVYTYDSLGQVTSGKKHFADSTPVGGAQYEYEFDTIGNREYSCGGTPSVASDYTANQLNQYESRTVPGKVLHTGTANSNAVVVIGVQDRKAVAANRQGAYYWQVFDVDNEAGLVATAAVACATMTQVVGTNTNHLVRIESREVLMPETPEEFSYDADGNLLSDGLWGYSWNGESRLIAIESGTAVPAVMKKRLTFAYDHQGRRTRKTVESGYSGGAYSTTNVTTFVWDGFNIIGEMSDAGYPNLYTFGLDLSGTLQGAGGVGGALSMTRGTNTYLYCYDGNGNVMALVSTSGTVVAEYEYDPFGVLIRVAGDAAADNSVRWSTKHTDPETELVMYELRVYSPALGRFLSRDPLSTRAQASRTGSTRTRRADRREHLEYLFVRNQAVSAVDYLGLVDISVPGDFATVKASWYEATWTAGNVLQGAVVGMFVPPGSQGNMIRGMQLQGPSPLRAGSATLDIRRCTAAVLFLEVKPSTQIAFPPVSTYYPWQDPDPFVYPIVSVESHALSMSRGSHGIFDRSAQEGPSSEIPYGHQELWLSRGSGSLSMIVSWNPFDASGINLRTVRPHDYGLNDRHFFAWGTVVSYEQVLRRPVDFRIWVEIVDGENRSSRSDLFGATLTLRAR